MLFTIFGHGISKKAKIDEPIVVTTMGSSTWKISMSVGI